LNKASSPFSIRIAGAGVGVSVGGGGSVGNGVGLGVTLVDWGGIKSMTGAWPGKPQARAAQKIPNIGVRMSHFLFIFFTITQALTGVNGSVTLSKGG
jgi:hypothetical protein